MIGKKIKRPTAVTKTIFSWWQYKLIVWSELLQVSCGGPARNCGGSGDWDDGDRVDPRLVHIVAIVWDAIKPPRPGHAAIRGPIETACAPTVTPIQGACVGVRVCVCV